MCFFLGTHCGGRRCALPPAPPHPLLFFNQLPLLLTLFLFLRKHRLFGFIFYIINVFILAAATTTTTTSTTTTFFLPSFLPSISFLFWSLFVFWSLFELICFLQDRRNTLTSIMTHRGRTLDQTTCKHYVTCSWKCMCRPEARQSAQTSSGQAFVDGMAHQLLRLVLRYYCCRCNPLYAVAAQQRWMIRPIYIAKCIMTMWRFAGGGIAGGGAAPSPCTPPPAFIF